MRFVPRILLSHDVPSWVHDGSLFFITINATSRGTNRLVMPLVAQNLLETVRVFQERLRWYARLFLLMPDHIHGLIAFPPDEKLADVIRDWKRYTARTFAISWQRGYFDHRIRNEENWELKATYIRENPVRKGLIACATDWPWKFEAS